LHRLKCSSYNTSDLIRIAFTRHFDLLINIKLHLGRITHRYIYTHGTIHIFCCYVLHDQIFCVRKILEKKWEYTATVHQPFVDFKKAYDSVQYSDRIWVPMKLVRLIKMCLNEMHSKVRIGKHMSDSFPIQNRLK
jgi:hypothetical protein